MRIFELRIRKKMGTQNRGKKFTPDIFTFCKTCQQFRIFLFANSRHLTATISLGARKADCCVLTLRTAVSVLRVIEIKAAEI